MPNYYDVGDIVRTSSTFTDTGSVKADPSAVDFIYTTPDGSDNAFNRTTTATGAVDTIVRSTVGNYHRDITTTASGTYWYRYASTGNITTAAEANFRVRRQYTAT